MDINLHCEKNIVTHVSEILSGNDIGHTSYRFLVDIMSSVLDAVERKQNDFDNDIYPVVFSRNCTFIH